MLPRFALFVGFAVAAASPADLAALAADDECLGEEQCSLSALQLRSVTVEQENSPDWVELAIPPAREGDIEGDNNTTLEFVSWRGWSQGGDKMWGQGRGVESINYGNVGYYDQGMYAAHARCGDPGCTLLVNPAGHRTVNTFHIHFFHYQGYGASLKHKLEAATCSRPNSWRHGHFPCSGQAAFFHGFPGVFRKAMAGRGSISAGVIAWPGACGGKGTIVELAYGCSIEHQIRGDYNPHYR